MILYDPFLKLSQEYGIFHSVYFQSIHDKLREKKRKKKYKLLEKLRS